MKKLSVIIPVFNEARTVENILARIARVELPVGVSKEMIVIDDYSTDGTSEILARLQKQHSLVILRHERNYGKGKAIRTGLTASTGDFAVIQDADLEYDPNEHPKLIAPLLSGETEIIFGSRYLGKRPSKMFSTNFFANRILTAVSNFFTGYRLTDMETCHKVFSRTAIDKIVPMLKSDRFDIEPEITAAAASSGFSVIEVPISYEPRSAREGKKIKWHDGFPAVWAIVKFGLKPLFKRRKWPVALVLSLSVLIVLFAMFRGPNILGDTPSYLKAIDVLRGSPIEANFVPNRLLTTFLGLEIINWLSCVLGGVLPAWFVINSVFYALSCVFFFKLLSRFFKNERTAYLGTIFLAGNYGFYLFGLNYLMDIGGWSFYIFSIYFLYKYSQSKRSKDLLYSALMVGIGGLFKEYAFFGAIAIAVYLIWEKWHVPKVLLSKAVQTALVAFVPISVLYLYVYSRFGYTYLDWLGYSASHYIYNSRILEFIKSLGSLVNVLAIVFLGGLYAIVKGWREISGEAKAVLFSVLVSFLPVFFWPAITQRIFTLVMPFIIIVSCFFFNRQSSRWYYFIPVFVLYFLATFFMDAYILNAVNLPF